MKGYPRPYKNAKTLHSGYSVQYWEDTKDGYSADEAGKKDILRPEPVVDLCEKKHGNQTVAYTEARKDTPNGRRCQPQPTQFDRGREKYWLNRTVGYIDETERGVINACDDDAGYEKFGYSVRLFVLDFNVCGVTFHGQGGRRVRIPFVLADLEESRYGFGGGDGLSNRLTI